MAAPTIIGTPVFGDSNGTSHTQAVTVPAGSNTALVVITFQGGVGSKPTGVTWDGNNMTRIVDLNAAQQIAGQMYFYASPAATTANVVASYAGSNADTSVVAFTLENCHQTAASVVDDSDQANKDGNNPSVALDVTLTTTDSDRLIITWLGTATLASNLTPNTGQSDLVADQALGNIDFAASYETAAAAGNHNAGYTWTSNASADMFAVALKGVASAGGDSHLPYFSLLGVGQ